MTHEIRGVDVEQYAFLCQQTSPKRWLGNMEMTSNCDVTNSAHQIQMTTTWPLTNPPPWKLSAYATESLTLLIFTNSYMRTFCVYKMRNRTKFWPTFMLTQNRSSFVILYSPHILDLTLACPRPVHVPRCHRLFWDYWSRTFQTLH